MAAGFGSIASCLYDKTFRNFEHSPIRLILEKTIVIAFASLCTYASALSLKGRVNISWEAAGRFALVELFLTCVTYWAAEKTTPQKPIDPREEFFSRFNRNIEASGLKARLEALRDQR